MDEKNDKINMYLMQLILSFQAGAMQQMGKIASPISGKIERDLAMAGNTIEMLSMLEVKMKGNLTDEEEKLIGHILYELRLNYVDETKKDDSKPDETIKKEETDEKSVNESELGEKKSNEN